MVNKKPNEKLKSRYDIKRWRRKGKNVCG